jgi:hypothetical protein
MRGINEGLNVVENWNSANDFIFYGEKGEIATNRIEDQELAMLALHLLLACLVYVNTLFIQEVLAGPAWHARMTPDDWRALSPLIYHPRQPVWAYRVGHEPTVPAGGLASLHVPNRLGPNSG